MKKGTSFWDLIKTIFGYFFTKRKETKEEQIKEAVKIETKLKEEYKKIDKEKEEDKKSEDLDDVQKDLNNMF